MYDYEKDPLETESILIKDEYAGNRFELENLFRECMNREFTSCGNYSKIADYREPVSTVKN
jgi:hypothetical protein